MKLACHVPEIASLDHCIYVLLALSETLCTAAPYENTTVSWQRALTLMGDNLT